MDDKEMEKIVQYAFGIDAPVQFVEGSIGTDHQGHAWRRQAGKWTRHPEFDGPRATIYVVRDRGRWTT